MSGVFEQALARIDAAEKQLAAIIAHLQGGGAAQAQVQPPVAAGGAFGLGGVVAQAAAPPANQFGLGGAATVQSTVTADMIQQLIMPLIQNEQAKAAIIGQMQAMGIQNLPDTRPDQMPELYQRFQQVAAQYGGGVTQQQTAAPSII